MDYINILQNINIKIDIDSKRYVYNGKFVPRVTEILSSTIHEEYLLDWSNHLGFSRKNYRETLQWYADVGTIVHSIIEDLINKGYSDRTIKSDTMISSVNNAVMSFIEWYSIILNNNSKIICTEKKLICEWFGGTCDLLININGKNYLIDFKTSKRISFKHFLQLSAYKYICELNNIKIDGVGILLLSRDRVQFSENILHMDIQDHKDYIDMCTNTFFSLVCAYYNRIISESMLNSIL